MYHKQEGMKSKKEILQKPKDDISGNELLYSSDRRYLT